MELDKEGRGTYSGQVEIRQEQIGAGCRKELVMDWKERRGPT